MFKWLRWFWNPNSPEFVKPEVDTFIIKVDGNGTYWLYTLIDDYTFTLGSYSTLELAEKGLDDHLDYMRKRIQTTVATFEIHWE